MDEQEDNQGSGRNQSEGVRIIGAEEAAAALENGQAGGRRADDGLRFGDVPPAPDGPRPNVSFPLPESVDPSEVTIMSTAGNGGEAPGEFAAPAPQMPHWTEPPTGEVPQVLVSDDGPSTSGPTWRDESTTGWGDEELTEALSLEADDEPLGVNAADETSVPFSFDDPAFEAGQSDPVVVVEEGERSDGPTPISSRSRHEPPFDGQSGLPKRNLGTAVTTGGLIAVAALVAFAIGPVATLILATAILLLAAVEVFDVLRRAGYRPATLLGLTAIVGIMLATYARGETAIPLVLTLTFVFSLFWYLAGVAQARPTINVAATMFGFLWVGLLGSYAALLLALPNREGIAYLAGAILVTVGYDVGAYVIGGHMGHRPLAARVSPNKTVEGAMGGTLAALVVSVLLVARIHPWSMGEAFWLGILIAVVAPLGDLCESLVKRDIGLKDMGSVLPGHGGVMDRFDALLFALPATYYLVRVLA